VDEIFTLDRRRVMKLCRTLAEDGPRFNWGCGTRADRIDEEMIELMHRAGCRKIGFGIESGVERIRFAAGKKITNDQVRQAVAICRKHGLRVGGSFILGLPGETVEDMRQTIRFARSLPLNTPGFNRMIPIPNSQLFAEAVEQGQLPPDLWTQFMLGERPYPVYTPAGLEPAVTARMHSRAFLSTYLWPTYLWRNRSVFLSLRYFTRAAREFWTAVTGKRYR
ncbi:MAG: radical SAM protein, partial [Planctomycetes bacterium]|nr:radical SAM protein [Planctomycetota bacterium]